MLVVYVKWYVKNVDIWRGLKCSHFIEWKYLKLYKGELYVIFKKDDIENAKFSKNAKLVFIFIE